MININLAKATLALLLLCTSAGSVAAQNNTNVIERIRSGISTKGNFAVSFHDSPLSFPQLERELNTALGLSGDFTFNKVKEQTDFSGTVHLTYEQYYRGIKVQNGIVLVHIKEQSVTSVNGNILKAPLKTLVTIPAIQASEALRIAGKSLNIERPTATYNPELVIYQSMGEGELAYKVRIDGFSGANKFCIYQVYVSALDARIINKGSLIAHADVPANAHTVYSGVRNIISDSYPGGYRLRDNGRKIETYNVNGLSPNMQGAPAFSNPNDVTNSSTIWPKKLFLASTSLTKAADSIRFTGLYDPMISFMSGWLIRSSIDELQPPASYQNIKDDLLLPDLMNLTPVTLPLTDNLGIVLNASSKYHGRFRKDSVALSFNPLNFQMQATTLAYDNNTIEYDIDTLTPGIHQWSNPQGDNGHYEIKFSANPEVDVHWGMEQTYDFFKTTFNYYSYNNDSTAVIRNYYDGVAALTGTQNNAMALPSPYFAMAYGTGDGIKFNPVVSLDVEGHEFTHLITANNANLNYQGESGALNESFSDMMGTAIVYFAKGPAAVTWNVGDSVPITIPYIRSLAHPKSPATFTDTSMAKPQPDTYFGQYWADTSSSAPDNGGVHINSGIGNKWFYLLANGGSGVNDNQYAYSINPIGIDKAQKIAFLTFTNYLTATARYYDAYSGSLLATAALYGQGSAEYSTVKSAWKAVGIPKDSTTGITEHFQPSGVMQIYPNPSSGKIQIESSFQQEVQGLIYNSLGAKVMTLTIHRGTNELDLTCLGKGVYFVSYQHGDKRITEKIILTE